MNWVQVGGVAGALLTLAACDEDGRTRQVRLGAILSGTGAMAGAGSAQLEAAVLAAEEINGRGGVLGSPLSILWRDDKSDPVRARAAAQSLASQKVVAVIGAVGTEETLAASAVLANSRIVLVSASATATLITDARDKGYLFRTCASDAFQGRVLARRAAARNLHQVAIVRVPGKFGAAFAEEFDAAFNAAGGSISSSREYTPGQPDYLPLLADVYRWGKPEGLLIVGHPADSAQIVRDYVENYADRKTVLFFSSTLQAPAFLTAVGPSNFTFEHEGTGPGAPTGPRYDSFVAAYQVRYGRAPQAFAANAYDAVYLLALAIEAAGTVEDGAAIREALIDVSLGGLKFGPDNYAQALTAASEGRGLNYEGVSGPVDFDDQGDVIAPFDIWRVADGQISVVESAVSP